MLCDGLSAPGLPGPQGTKGEQGEQTTVALTGAGHQLSGAIAQKIVEAKLLFAGDSFYSILRILNL